MSEKTTFHGVITALVTPVDSNGAIDQSSLASLAAWQATQVDGLFVLGTSGEGVLFPKEERMLAVETIMDAVGSRIPVMVHVGSLTTRESITLAAHAQGYGASAISVINPFYFTIPDKNQIEHFIAIAQAAPLTPFYLYNNPGVTQNTVSDEILQHIGEHVEQFAGIKDSSKNLDTLSHFKSVVGNSKEVLVGGDLIFANALKRGISGAVSTVSNIFPELFVKIYESFCHDDFEAMLMYQEKVSSVIKILTSYPYYSAIKHLLVRKGMGMTSSNTCAPLGRLKEGDADQLVERLRKLNIKEIAV
jgi:4-hydroxy-tetrahydrodipicolinate synthase